MTKKHSTKKALLSSVISLALCLTMLIGATFAWFTDSVTSANNIITSGNLDIELYYQLEGQTDWTKVTESTNVFKEDSLWEPGHTEVVKLKVVNEGSLAIKYNLGVNVASEVGSVNVNGVEFLLSEFIKFAVIDGANSYTRDAAVAAAEAAGATALKTAYNSGTTQLLSTEEDYVTMVVYMPTTVGNDANPAKGAPEPTINLGINLLATQAEAEADSFGTNYDADAMTFVTNTEEAQAALDNATEGTTIQLAPGVQYGKLAFRRTANSTVVDITTAGGDAPGNEKYRSIENLTILGADGAVVEGFDFQVGWIDGSGAAFVDVKGLTVEGVTFSGTATPFNFDGSKGSALGIDGLTIKNCKMNDANGNDRFVFQQITGYKDLIDKTTGEYVMTTGIKNLTITECEVTGAYMVIESRAMENLTITNNTFKGIKARDMLITSDTANHPNVTYTGAITITGNTSIGGEERFVRGSLNNSAAVVVIKDNTLIGYLGADDDYIKVTDGANVTVENNTMTRKYVVSVADSGAIMTMLQTSVEDGAIVYFEAADYGKLSLGGGHFNATLPKNITIECAPGATLSLAVDKSPNASVPFDGVMDGWTFKNVNFVDDGFRLQNGAQAKNLRFEGCTFSGGATFYALSAQGGFVDGAVFDNCYFYDTVLSATNKNAISIQAAKNITVTNCVFYNVRNSFNLGSSAEGEIVITFNEVKSGTDRILRFTDAGAVYTIANNIIRYNGDNGEFVKVATAENATFTFSNNDWNGKTDAQVTAGLIGSDYIVK